MNLHRTIIVNEEGTLRRKAGIVPFIADGRCMFIVPKGSTSPEIAKGKLDGDEDSKAAAVREGAEELGLKKENMAASPFLGWTGTLTGGSGQAYTIDVYAALVKDEEAFDHPEPQVEKTVWLTRSEFAVKGRKAQTQIMDKLFDKIEAYLKK